jgi:hypothetical protein
VVFVRLPAGRIVVVTDYGRTVVETPTRRRHADSFESEHDRRSGNCNRQSDPHAAESPKNAHSATDPSYLILQP